MVARTWTMDGDAQSVTWTADDGREYTAHVGARMSPVGLQGETCVLKGIPGENTFLVEVDVQGRAREMYHHRQIEVRACSYKKE